MRNKYSHYDQVPRTGERAIFNMGIPPSSFVTQYKKLELDGMAKEFIAFEMLYDTNPQAYDWLYSTRYGVTLFRMMCDLVEGHGLSTEAANVVVYDALVEARNEYEHNKG